MQIPKSILRSGILSQPSKLDQVDDISTVSRTETTGTWRDKYQESLHAVCPFDYDTEEDYLNALKRIETDLDEDADEDNKDAGAYLDGGVVLIDI